MTSNSKNSRGFTLIEVLISITLLVFISMAIYQGTTETYKLREVLINEGDFYNGIRLSMTIMERDVALLYSPTLLGIATKSSANTSSQDLQNNQLQQDLTKALGPEALRTTDYWTGAIDTSGIRPSRFVGTASKMSFIALSHMRVYKDSPEGEIVKVEYDLRDDPDSKDVKGVDPALKQLVKIYDTSPFDDESKKDTFQRTLPLLKGIKKLSYRFYRKDKNQWDRSWDSDKEDTKNQYPDMIEVVIEVEGPTRLHYDGKYIFRPELPIRGLIPSS